MAEEQRDKNRRFLEEALDEFKTDVMQLLDSRPNAFFNGNLELTVQDGVIRTAKPGIQKCRHATVNRS